MYESAQRENLNGKADHIRKSAARAARHLQDDAEDAVASVAEAINAVGEDLGDLARQAGRRVRGTIDSVSENVVQATDGMTTTIRDNPIQSSLIALGIGAVIGLMLRR